METREILELVRSGSMSVEEAEGHFRRQPFEDMGFAKLDLHRKMRSGFPEVIFCSGKPDEFLVSIYQRRRRRQRSILAREWNGSMMWASAGFTGCWHRRRNFRRRTAW